MAIVRRRRKSAEGRTHPFRFLTNIRVANSAVWSNVGGSLDSLSTSRLEATLVAAAIGRCHTDLRKIIAAFGTYLSPACSNLTSVTTLHAADYGLSASIL